ncbi:MAG: hypothetical protein KZQ58_07325 [gamma proteobacterium symbiont of Bathyaustriella thionipta]|nr:hypothetical protein [gamma proteobacterium symbiont of Bathyaustriella thionipta]
MEYKVFIQTNAKQYIGALAAAHSLKRFSKHADKFSIEIINVNDYPYFKEYEGQYYLRDGAHRRWLNEDLQSFTLTRFMPPELMNYKGRAVVIDPDVFAVSDVWDLLSRDMQGKAIMVRPRSGRKKRLGCMATSVMLLDCEKLKHWRVEDQFRAMFKDELDYMQWICLKNEDPDIIGQFENEWNDFDHLTPETRMLHTTKRKTQPWKTGLNVDFRPPERFRLFPPSGWMMFLRRKLFGEYAFMGKYHQHPDMAQQELFFGLVQECIDNGSVSQELLQEAMQKNYVRHDAVEVLKNTPPLAEQKYGARVV